MSCCVMRMCSSSSQGECGSPCTRLPCAARSRSASAASEVTCASPKSVKRASCWRSGSGVVMGGAESLIAHLDVPSRDEDRHGRAILFEQIEQIGLVPELVLGWLCSIALAVFRALHVVLG